MPRQLDQLPSDPTTLARKVAALERQVKELRGARRMTAATVGTLRVYAEDGTTLLAELGPETGGDGGGGLWTRGLQDPINMSAYLSSGVLQFRPVEDDRVAVPASIQYASDADQFTDLILTSGSVKASHHRAIMTLESAVSTVDPYVYMQAESGGPCNLDVSGIFTAGNLAWGQVSITPSAANTPTSVNVTGLAVQGTTFLGYASAATTVPGTQVTGVGATAASSTGVTVWATRTNTTAVIVNWMVIGA